MLEALKIAQTVIALTPTVRKAVIQLIKAFGSGDDIEIRRAYEAALRERFEARQKQ